MSQVTVITPAANTNTGLETETPTPKLTRSEQARINGRNSQGPSTPEGRAKSSRNALKHGLSATVHTVLAFESQPTYTANEDAWVQNLMPADPVELRLVIQIANIQWRLERLVKMETSLLNLALCDNFEHTLSTYAHIDDVGALAAAWSKSAGQGNGLDLLRRYLATLQSQFNATFKTFEKLEARRRDPRRVREIDNPIVPYQRPDLPVPQLEEESLLQNEPKAEAEVEAETGVEAPVPPTAPILKIRNEPNSPTLRAA
jgi:hypothetical protein